MTRQLFDEITEPSGRRCSDVVIFGLEFAFFDDGEDP